MLEARVERIRTAKQARLQETCKSSGQDNQHTHGRPISTTRKFHGYSMTRSLPACSSDGVIQKDECDRCCREAASITYLLQRVTVRHYRKKFFPQMGRFKEGEQGKYKMHCFLPVG